MQKLTLQNLSAWVHAPLTRRLGLGLAGFLLLVIALQLVYPRDRVLPNAHMQGIAIGWQQKDDAVGHTAKALSMATVTFATDTFKESVSADVLGIDVVTSDAVQRAMDYAWWQRLIPFTVLQARSVESRLSYDDDRIVYYAEQFAKKHNTAARNAGVQVEGGGLKLLPGAPSYTFEPAQIVRSVKDAPFDRRMTIRLAAVTTDPIRTDAAVQALIDRVADIIAHPPTVRYAGQSTKLTSAQIVSWIAFPEDPATKKLYLSINTDAVRAFAETVQQKAYKAPGTSVVTIVDGSETSRTAASPGQGLDAATATQRIADGLLSKATTIDVPTVALPAKVTYQRQYSSTQNGLNALLGDIAGGMGVSVIELGGAGRTASTNGDRRFTAASTYKLFVAYGVVKRVEAGAFTWETPVNGNTVAGCFDSMIVRSDNPCAKALGEMVGWGDIQAMMRAIGLGSTTLTNGFYTTPNDLARFLRLLQSGTLLSASGSSRLLDAMHRQVYRSGIPAGTGVRVADKVGFIGSLIHDAGIVYGPNGPYVLVIMTSDSSWSAIASVSRQIHTFLNR